MTENWTHTEISKTIQNKDDLMYKHWSMQYLLLSRLLTGFLCTIRSIQRWGIYCVEWRLSNARRPAVLHRLRPRYDKRTPAVSDFQLHSRHSSCLNEIHVILDHQDPEVIRKGLLRTESHSATEGKGGHCQLRPLQVAAVVLAVLRGVQVCWPESAEERRPHCRQLDWSLRCWWSGTGARRTVVPRDHRRLQQQVSADCHIPIVMSIIIVDNFFYTFQVSSSFKLSCFRVPEDLTLLSGHSWQSGWINGWLGFYGIFSTPLAAVSWLK